MQNEILSNKNVILSSPGYLYNDLYYSELNSSSSLVEATYVTNKWSVNLSSPVFGSSSSVNIPNRDFIGTTILIMELPDVVSNQTLCRGWGYGAIDRIEYVLGSSNVSNLSISGESLWGVVASQCMTAEKRSEIWSLGGEEILAPTGGPVTASIVLPFPWSNCCEKLYFDTTLLSSNIFVTIVFKQTSAIYGGSGIRPTNMNSAIFTYRGAELTDKRQSMRDALISNPNLSYAYPMFHHQSTVTSAFAGKTPGTGQCLVNLQGFINSDLVGIIFYAIKQTDVYPTSNNSPKPFNTTEISNILIQYNGTTMYNAPKNSYKLINLFESQNSSTWQNSAIRAGASGPFLSDPIDNSFVFYNVSKERAACIHNFMPNTMRLSNQTLNVTFNTPTTDNYLFYATYVYNGCCELKNGNSFIYFD